MRINKSQKNVSKKRHLKKRILGTLLAGAMVAASFSTAVRAEEEEPETYYMLDASATYVYQADRKIKLPIDCHCHWSHTKIALS